MLWAAERAPCSAPNTPSCVSRLGHLRSRPLGFVQPWKLMDRGLSLAACRSHSYRCISPWASPLKKSALTPFTPHPAHWLKVVRAADSVDTRESLEFTQIQIPTLRAAP